MYGDTEVMRRRAGQLREQGVDVRALADQLVAQTESIGWTGRAAESMRHRIQERAAHLRTAAAQHETAADSLDRHVHEVEGIQDTIAQTERRAASLVAEARTRIARIESANETESDSGVHTTADADDGTLADFTPPPSGHQDWLTVTCPASERRGNLADHRPEHPAPPPDGILDALPRRVALTLPELRLVAELAGGAPLPFEVESPGEAPAIEDRLGQSPGTTQNQAYVAVLESLHDAETSLARRGLLTDGAVDDGLLGAVGLLATPELAVDIDVVAGSVQAKAWHRQSGGAVATLATVDGIVFELAWFPTAQWSSELGRVGGAARGPHAGETSGVPAAVVLPYELADAAAEAVVASRSDLLPVLVAQHLGQVLDEAGKPLSEPEVVGIVAALSSEARGRLRALVADVSGETTTVVGVVSWTLLADGWHALRPQQTDGALSVDVRRVAADDLGADLAPVLAAVSS